MILFSEYLTRIGCAFVMGTFIGVERQIRQRNAGLRTNILVSIGAAAFTILSYSMTTGNGDPSRVAAQIDSKGRINGERSEYSCHYMVFGSMWHSFWSRTL